VTPPRRFHRNFEQILTWSVVSAPLWIGGALAVDGARWVLWLAAMGIDLAAAGPVLAAEVGAHPQ
jgi:low temperature requirement protein LtrA